MFDRDLLSKANEISDFLEDELSREVFQYRLVANLSGDVRYIHRLLTKTGCFCFDKAYEMYKKVENEYNIYPKLDVISFLQTRKNNKPVILFGAGHDAELYYSLLNEIGVQIVAIIDNEKTGFFNGVPVYRPENYDQLINSTVIITSRIHSRSMYWEMIGRGVPKDQVFVPDINGLFVFSMEEYFDNKIWSGGENEIFVDAGAYNLQTAYDFTKYAISYKKIYSFEPDKQNFEMCMDRQKELNIDNLELINAGLWDKDDTLRFVRGGDNGTGTCVSDIGMDELQVRALDSFLAGRPVTFIKMDIEGSELKALEGACETIKKYKPRLAICLYHKPMDLIDIPLFIKKLVPEYKIKIRHYSTWFFDTVMYAYVS